MTRMVCSFCAGDMVLVEVKNLPKATIENWHCQNKDCGAKTLESIPKNEFTKS